MGGVIVDDLAWPKAIGRESFANPVVSIWGRLGGSVYRARIGAIRKVLSFLLKISGLLL
jgi:hypothetical protein